MTFRELTKEDAQLVARFNSEFFSDGWTESMLLSGFNCQRLYLFGAFDGDNLLGYIALSLSLDTADVESVVVQPSMRKQGIADTLFNMAENFVLSKGIKKILLEVRESNIPAISLYKKKNFALISKRNKYYHDGENALVLMKEFV